MPLFLVHSLALLVEGLKTSRLPRLAAAGALLGLGAHSYPSFRMAPLILPLYLVAEIGPDPKAWKRAAKGLTLFIAMAALLAAPMALHYLHHPEQLNNPRRIVSVFSPKVDRALVPSFLRRNLVATLLMFHLHGDDNWRHNLAGAPLLDPLTGALLLLGIVRIAWRAWPARGGAPAGPPGSAPAAALLFPWIPVMLLPNLLSVQGVPHALRSCGVLPALVLLAGIGLDLVHEALARVAGARAALAATMIAWFFLGGLTYHRYFTTWGEDPRVFAEHDGAFRAAARLLLAAPPGVGRLLVANGTGFPAYGQPAEVEPYLFEMRARPPVVIGPHDGGLLALAGRPALVALVRRDERILETIRALNPSAPVAEVAAPGLSPDSPVYRVN
ncbi:MAG TPA: hypothetical protein VFT43_03070 [Candidatus Polarisedimenticolia bacterium]|nr:hypothetical protein [Candidatus Polarisedimenticolia bacterium]